LNGRKTLPGAGSAHRQNQMLDQPLDENDTWLCEHEPPDPPTTLHEADKSDKPPHYVICPDCGTHWVVYQCLVKKRAAAVITPY